MLRIASSSHINIGIVRVTGRNYYLACEYEILTIPMPDKIERALDKPADKKIEGAPEQADAQLAKMAADTASVLSPERVAARQLADEAAIQGAHERLGNAPKSSVPAPKDEPKKFTTAEVKTRQEFKDTMIAYDKIFTDPTDKDSPISMARLFFSPELARYYQFKNDANETIGMQLHRINPHIPDAGYTPYGGLLTDYKSLNIYPKMAKIADEQMKVFGVKFIMNDCEDPARILNVAAEAYPGEDPSEVVARCERRLNFFRRSMGQMYVNDPNIPYMRPASDDPKNPDPEKSTQAYDLLGFRALDPNDPMWKDAFNENKTMLKKEVYGDMYLKLMQLEFGDKNGVPSKEELRLDYPAIDQFFKNFDNYQGEWVALLSDTVREKSTPNTSATIEAGTPSDADERDRWMRVPRKGPGWEEPLQDRKAV